MKIDGDGNWINKAMSKPGAKGGLHRSLGIPQGQKIPAARLEAASHSSNPKTKKEAQMAKNMRGGK